LQGVQPCWNRGEFRRLPIEHIANLRRSRSPLAIKLNKPASLRPIR
jgi:hypothetical protein